MKVKYGEDIHYWSCAYLALATPKLIGAIALSYPPRVRVRATVKLSAAFFHDESSITIGKGGAGGGTKVQ